LQLAPVVVSFRVIVSEGPPVREPLEALPACSS
jgi:hypothetical protein